MTKRVKRPVTNTTTDSVIGWVMLAALVILVAKSFAPVPPGMVINLYQEKKLQDAQPDSGLTPQTQPSLTPNDRQQIDCLSKNIYYEARAESDPGKLAVALVTFNRLKDGFASNVCDVVYQKTVYKKRTTFQFSWTGEKHDFGHHEKASWDRCYEIAHAAYVQQIKKHNPIKDFTGGARYYYAHRLVMPPGWAYTHVHTAAIGGHWFYR